mmetsp:Transcript_3273/g.10916  ORF Transcript_3273/g.10916 Transcript_3273/m.10916 type:complete len:219 (+) Transcript_3273:233-889(+)
MIHARLTRSSTLKGAPGEPQDMSQIGYGRGSGGAAPGQFTGNPEWTAGKFSGFTLMMAPMSALRGLSYFEKLNKAEPNVTLAMRMSVYGAPTNFLKFLRKACVQKTTVTTNIEATTMLCQKPAGQKRKMKSMMVQRNNAQAANALALRSTTVDNTREQQGWRVTVCSCEKDTERVGTGPGVPDSSCSPRGSDAKPSWGFSSSIRRWKPASKKNGLIFF